MYLSVGLSSWSLGRRRSQLSCPVRALAIMLRHLSLVLLHSLDDGVLVGCMVQPLLQAIEVLGLPGPFVPSNLQVITKFSSFDFMMTWPQNSACFDLFVFNRCRSMSARLRTLLLVSRSVQGMRSIRCRNHISAASRRASSPVSTSRCSMLELTVRSCSGSWVFFPMIASCFGKRCPVWTVRNCTVDAQ